jgi:hypothetical protein
VRSGTSWTQQAKLVASTEAAYVYFGASVSLSGDTALVGAPSDDNEVADSGSTYVFVRSGTSWTQQAKLSAWDAAAGDKFGHSVSLSGDTALIGAYGDADGGTYSGSVYIFRLQNDGVPDLAVFDFLNMQVVSGGAASSFAGLLSGTTHDYIFTMKNVGTLDLDIQSVSLGGSNLGEFALIVPDISSTNDLMATEAWPFTVRFAPTGTTSGERNAVIVLASNDPDQSVFSVHISGPVFSDTADIDGDGLNDWAEYQARILGLDWETAQPALVTAFLDGADGAGLVYPEDVGGISSSFQIVPENPATGEFSLRMRLHESSDLTNFVPMILNPDDLNVNADGDIQYDFQSSDDKKFYRASFQ